MACLADIEMASGRRRGLIRYDVERASQLVLFFELTDLKIALYRSTPRSDLGRKGGVSRGVGGGDVNPEREVVF